ncbi:MAG: demethoxyubiquinone hydroxylase family protein [Alphaproteobacteria bacterium]|nr:MAG: demethoxyubiquinone hydroxylase family protein [Alphaproteobacteria bacterium]
MMHKNIRHAYLRVNHAGELGAIHIYKGQLAVLKDTPLRAILDEMHDHEQAHLDAFNVILPDEAVRPSALTPLWKWGGFALGICTGFLGEKAAMACTVAVEEVIVEHYQEQIAQLDECDPLREKITAFCAEEEQHRQEGITYGAETWMGFYPLTAIIKTVTRTCVGIAKRL